MTMSSWFKIGLWHCFQRGYISSRVPGYIYFKSQFDVAYAKWRHLWKSGLVANMAMASAKTSIINSWLLYFVLVGSLCIDAVGILSTVMRNHHDILGFIPILDIPWWVISPQKTVNKRYNLMEAISCCLMINYYINWCDPVFVYVSLSIGLSDSGWWLQLPDSCKLLKTDWNANAEVRSESSVWNVMNTCETGR